MEEKRSPLKAIRLKCLDCSCGNINDVKSCTHTQCALHSFRLGKNPNARHEPTAAQLEALRNGRVAFGSVDKHGNF